MKSIDYAIVSQTRKISLKRLQTKTVRVAFKNVGPARWFSSALKTEKQHVVLTTNLEQSSPDFRLVFGPTSERTNRKFVSLQKIQPTSTKQQQHTADMGDTVEFMVHVTPKKYATKGWHTIELMPTLLENPEHPSKNAGATRVTRIYVTPQYYAWFHLKRTVRLKLARPGRTAGSFENKAFKEASADDRAKRLPVIMAMWQRIEHLPRTIESLEKQRGVQPALYIWNNNPAIRGEIEKKIALSPLPIKVVHSAYNIGGFGRFYLARMLKDQFERALFIDDDQLLEPETIQGFAQEFEPQTIKGYWAYNFTIPENYWRKNLAKPQKSAHYVGTGGMLADLSIFEHPAVFSCPKRFWFIEDLWLCFVASHHLGWKVTRSKTDLEIEVDGKDQLNRLIDLKTKMLQYLMSKKGWKIL